MWTLLAWAGVVGVGIDLDHLLVARANTGDWSALRRLLRTPSMVVLDQDAIFEADDLRAGQRLLSHHVLGGLLVAALLPASTFLAVFTAVVLYAHVLVDLVHDNRQSGREPRRPDPPAETNP